MLTKTLTAAQRKATSLIPRKLQRRFEANDVQAPKYIGHKGHLDYLVQIGNYSGKKILEIGSRKSADLSVARERFHRADYIGFDYYPGGNVDVVGDAHQLSRHFDNDFFDIVFLTSVLEHLAMPWQVAHEIAKVLKVGGVLYVESHFSYSSHSRPWHFFHFTDLALKALFFPALGFCCVDAGMSNPIVGFFSYRASKHLRYRPVAGLYCHSHLLAAKIKNASDFNWNEMTLTDVIGESHYPDSVK